MIFIVAYNAEKTIESVLRRISPELSVLYEVEVLIIDDSSQDNTFAKSEQNILETYLSILQYFSIVLIKVMGVIRKLVFITH